MGFINLGRLNIRKRNSCASALVSLSDVQPPSVYKSNILNGPINKLYIILFLEKRQGAFIRTRSFIRIHVIKLFWWSFSLVTNHLNHLKLYV